MPWTTRLAFALCSAGALAVADDVPPMAPGTRVRVTVPKADGPLVGSLLAWDEKSLTLHVEGQADPRTLARGEIATLAVSAGRGSRARGALIGAGIGIGLAALVGIATAKDDGFGPTGGAAAGIAALWLAPIGALAGAASPPAERWTEVSLDHVSLSLAPVRGRGVAVALAVH